MVTFAMMKSGQTAGQNLHKTILAIGSNKDAEANISRALGLLAEYITDIRQSQTLRTEALDGAKGTFSNLMLLGHTALSLEELTAKTKETERLCGRIHGNGDGGMVSMDIDIMDYDGQKLHSSDWQRDYIRTLIKEV